MSAYTPIEKLIDSAVVCLICHAPMGACECWDRIPKSHQRAIGMDIANSVGRMLAEHYPEEWNAMKGKGAWRSIRGCIQNGVRFHLDQFNNKPKRIKR